MALDPGQSMAGTTSMELERWLSGLKHRTCSRRQDAEANIGAADGPKGEAQDVPSQSGVLFEIPERWLSGLKHRT